MTQDTQTDTHETAGKPAAEAAGSHEPQETSAPVGTRKSGARVLVIDDEAALARVVRGGLSGAGFVVEWEATAAQGIERVAQWRPDVVILDLALAGVEGIEVCRELRAWTAVPIIALSVRDAAQEKVALLDAGADDYLTKPFDMDELIARVRVALRHAAPPVTDAVFQTGELAIDFERRRVTMSGRELHLTPTEYAVLKYLAQHVGKVVTHHMLLHSVWGPDYETEAHYLRVFMNQLRRKIEPDPSRPHYLLTEPGVGYRLRSPD